MAKFRSNTDIIVDRWLDDEKPRKGKKKSPKSHIDADWLEPSEANGTVIGVYHKQCRVEMDETQKALLCNYRRKKVYIAHEDGHRERAPVAVGDRVKVVPVGLTDGVVEGVCKRVNVLTRPAPGKEQSKTTRHGTRSHASQGTEWVHVLAANIDYLVIVASAKDPDFSPGLVDRFLICAKKAGIRPILCINKLDLWTEESGLKPWNAYAELKEFYQLEIFELSVKKGFGIDTVISAIQGKTTVFSGHSGVGKTSLLRIMVGHDLGELGEINSFTGKGKHTTTGSNLFHGREGIKVIDTPGIRSLGLHGLNPQTLKDFFPEFNAYPCPNKACTHLENEQECKVKESASHLPRYQSYLRIFESLLEGEG